MSGRPVGVGAARPGGWAYRQAPVLVTWQLTAGPGGGPRPTGGPAAESSELTTAEGVALLAQIARFGDPPPHLELTGGDPLRRADIGALTRAARARGIAVTLAPAITPLLTRARLAHLAADGVSALSLALDGSGPLRHEGLRRRPGSFDATLAALDWAAELALPVQVNTLVGAADTLDLPAVYDLLCAHSVARWSLAFLVSPGPTHVLREVSPGEAERLMTWLARLGREAPFQVRTTEPMHYHRVARCLARKGLTRAQIEAHPSATGFGIRDGNGTVCVGHDGTITPSADLPLPLGSVRRDSLVEVYRTHPTMRALRDPDGFAGRCGACDCHDWCGGSRARAFACTGDPLESDPLCSYVPRGYAAAPAGVGVRAPGAVGGAAPVSDAGGGIRR